MAKVYHDIKDLYADFPNVGDISKRLVISQKELAEYQKSKSENPAFSGKEPVAISAGVTYFRKDKKKEDWMFNPVKTRSEFEEQMLDVMMTRTPDSFGVGMYTGHRKSISREAVVVLDPSEDQEEHEEEKDPENPLVDIESIKKELLGAVTQQMAEVNSGASKHQIQLLQINFDNKLKDLQHAQEIRDLKAQHEKEIEKLNRLLKEKNEEILDLEEELAEADSELGSVNEELAKKREPSPLTDIAGDILKKGLAGFLKTYPKVTESMTGLNEEQQAKMWIEAEKRLSIDAEKSVPSGSDASFSEASSGGIDFTGINEEQVEGIKILLEFMKQLSIEQFKKVYYFFTLIIDEEGHLNEQYLDDVYKLLNDYAKLKEEKSTEQ